MVRPDSPVYTAQQLANRTVGVPFYFGTHYLALHLLEGFLPRELIKVVQAPNGSRYRFDSMMRGEIEATTLTEPYITLAEKKGCRTICSAFYHGTEVASDRVDAATYGAFNRAVREAVKRINANKRHISTTSSTTTKRRIPEIGTLKPEDIREGRIVVCDPAPIPLDEMQRTYDWLKSWGMLEETASPLELVNMQVQAQAHSRCGSGEPRTSCRERRDLLAAAWRPLRCGGRCGTAPRGRAAETDFYAGKTVQVLVGFGPGGGYDLYARTLARYMGKHIPGNPTVITQNMPGAGCMKVMNYLYNVARKDGTVIGDVRARDGGRAAARPREGTQFDATKFNWIGSISNEVGSAPSGHRAASRPGRT